MLQKLRFDIVVASVTVASVYLSDDEGVNAQCAIATLDDPLLNKVEVTAYYFPVFSTDDAAMRRSVVARKDALEVSLRYKEPIVRRLARGRVYMPQVYQNWGNLVSVAPGGSTTTVLSSCTVESVSVVDDPGINGIAYRIVFVKPKTALT